jgi:hypothetical protein
MTRFISVIAACLFAAETAVAALIPPGFLNSVVALGNTLPSTPLPGQASHPEWRTIGTGFFYGVLMEDDVDALKRKYRVVLVTARHVVAEHLQQNPALQLSVRMNPDEPSLVGKEFDIPNSDWHFHKDEKVDVAFVAVDMGKLHEMGINPVFYASDRFVANRRAMRENGVTEGDGIFVLGFPMNLAGAQRNYVIARQGCIARISEMLASVSPTFMIDSFVFPGNSGGPVILKPDLTSIQGTKAQNNAHLIGMVISYRPYADVAISPQTHRPRIVFEENSGLAEVLPTDYIDDAIADWLFTQTGSPPIPY